jgi:hypothetical protein
VSRRDAPVRLTDFTPLEITVKKPFILALAATALLQQLAFADVSYQETTQITGGSMVGMLKMAGAFSAQARQATQPTTSTIMIHGSRMVHVDSHTTEIIDLDQQSITYIDTDKHTYSIVTFAQMQQAMAKAAAQGKDKGSQTSASSAQQMSFSAHISNSGATRQINGQTAKEALLTLTMLTTADDSSNTKAGMAATSEMWLVNDAPGMDEMRKFNQRLAEELAVDMDATPVASLLAAQPGSSQALADLKKESAKMSGLPVLQITRVGVSPDGQPLPAPSTAPLADDQKQGSSTDSGSQSTNEKPSRFGGFGRALGGALMRQKSPASSDSDTASGKDSNGTAAGVLLESQTQLFNFSTAPIEGGTFQVPAGYRQVASPMQRK